MSVMDKFVALIMTTVTTFSGTYLDPNVRPAPEISGTYIQKQIDEATQQAQGAGVTAGISVIDRAKNNLMKTNDEAAHREFKMESAGRLPILLYAARIDPAVAKGEVQDITAMMQGVSGEATNRLWDKYGKTAIIADIATRYNLQETSSGNSWADTTTSSVDIGRMYRRFLDDDEVSTEAKKFVIDLLRDTSLTVVNEDFSFGLPSAVGIRQDTNDNKDLAWVQGWSASGSDPMIRTTTGVLGSDMRYIVVITGQASDPKMPDATANVILNNVAKTLLGEGGGSSGYFSKDDKEEHKDRIESFQDKQRETFGEDFLSTR